MVPSTFTPTERYQKSRSELVELDGELQKYERQVPFGATAIKHAQRALEVLPKDDSPDDGELQIACYHLRAIWKLLDQARDVIPSTIQSQLTRRTLIVLGGLCR